MSEDYDEFGPDIEEDNEISSVPGIGHKQRSPQWFKERSGKFTGSRIWKLTVEPKTNAEKAAGVMSATAIEYIRETLAEFFTGTFRELKGAALQWGIDNEDAAKEWYEKLTGSKVQEVGFIPYLQCGGGSPDGLINKPNIVPVAKVTGTSRGIAEIKCPYDSSVHVKNLTFAAGKPNAAMFKAKYREHYWQIQNNLMCTKRDWAHYISFDPRFPDPQKMAIMYIPRVEEDIEVLESVLKKAVFKLDEFKKDILAHDYAEL